MVDLLFGELQNLIQLIGLVDGHLKVSSFSPGKLEALMVEFVPVLSEGEEEFFLEKGTIQSIKILLCLVSDKIDSIFSSTHRIKFLQRAPDFILFLLTKGIFLTRNCRNNSRPPWIAGDFGPDNIGFAVFIILWLGYWFRLGLLERIMVIGAFPWRIFRLSFFNHLIRFAILTFFPKYYNQINIKLLFFPVCLITLKNFHKANCLISIKSLSFSNKKGAFLDFTLSMIMKIFFLSKWTKISSFYKTSNTFQSFIA